MKFYLGTHETGWVGKIPVPFMVSHRRIQHRRRLRPASAPVVIDSGGFSELSMYGAWRTTSAEYIDACRRYVDGLGTVDWCAPQDWMCEPFMVAKTGLSISEHQHRTVDNYCRLRQEAPDVPWIPVLQGWAIDDYMACIDLYDAAGVDLTDGTVGVGSVCRRQSTGEIAAVFSALHEAGVACHGFGVKTRGLSMYGAFLASSDSLAWSYQARRQPPLSGCAHRNCANCPRYALMWRERLLRRPLGPQPSLFDHQPPARSEMT